MVLSNVRCLFRVSLSCIASLKPFAAVSSSLDEHTPQSVMRLQIALAIVPSTSHRNPDLCIGEADFLMPTLCFRQRNTLFCHLFIRTSLRRSHGAAKCHRPQLRCKLLIDKEGQLVRILKPDSTSVDMWGRKSILFPGLNNNVM